MARTRLRSIGRSLSSMLIVLCIAGVGNPTALEAQERRARISEERRIIETYPYSEPNPIPILASDSRLYPYHRFEGYAHDAEPVEWTVVHLENDFIELWVLPEVGGKVWGARVKETGNEFIYRNEVMKFRNIALRGPWTSGGIEFNFGVIGHTPATAAPVDYLTVENGDGSVSVFVGTMDLPSRTRWRVEVRLPADRAYFETNVLWHNPTPLEQPYYNWMTAAAFAQDDLVMSIPGNAYLGHPGERHDWPLDERGRNLSVYDENRFGGNKSFHVVGELEDFFGGYYRDEDYGFGHWSRHEQMPGQKLWLWALSRQGGIWDDLLTDTDGQYIEFQAGRLLVQYSPGDAVNPISQAGFDPGATDRWTETWFPLEGLGGLTDASREGALHVASDDGRMSVGVQAFGDVTDTLRVLVDGRVVEEKHLELSTLIPHRTEIEVSSRGPDDGPGRVVVELARLGLRYDSDPDAGALLRPFVTDDDAMPSIRENDRLAVAARQLVLGRRMEDARPIFESVLAEEPWNRDALLGLADLEYRRGLYREGLRHVDRTLRLDAYDAEANFIAGNLYRALGHDLDARDAFGWAARSYAYRTASYTQLAELALTGEDFAEARRYARLALDYDRYNLTAYEVIAVAERVGVMARDVGAVDALASITRLDPLSHFVAAERFLSGAEGAGGALLGGLRSEYGEQELLELVISYVHRGRPDDAERLLELGRSRFTSPLLTAWAAWLSSDTSALETADVLDFVFPYRPETVEVLRWAASEGDHWSWTYLHALGLWARDRADEASDLLVELGDAPDFAPAYTARALLAQTVASGAGPDPADRTLDVETDLRRAVRLDPDARAHRVALVRFLQEEGRWEDALSAATAALERRPDDFDLALLRARALTETMRFTEAIEILDAVHVLPSENAALSHRLFTEAHTGAALAALGEADNETARLELEVAMEWPERLGQGRPYEPEERLQRFLLGVTEVRAGDDAAGRAAFESVLTATDPDVVSGDGVQLGRLDLLVIPSLQALGRSNELVDFHRSGPEGALARIASAVRSAASAGEDVTEALVREARSALHLFQDVEGRLLYRALALER